jgi:hypothetical protein
MSNPNIGSNMTDPKEILNATKAVAEKALAAQEEIVAPQPAEEKTETQSTEANSNEVRHGARDWREIDIAEWAEKNAGSSYSTEKLKQSLYQDFSELPGEAIDKTVQASEQYARMAIESAKGEIPYSAFAALTRSTAALLAKDTLKNMDDARVASKQRAQDLMDVAREEFGPRHYVAMSEEAERNYSLETGIPIEEVKELNPQRYRNIMRGYHDRKFGAEGRLTAAETKKENHFKRFFSN